MRVKTFTKLVCSMFIISFNSQGSVANPIIENVERLRSRPGYYLNQPQNGGTTTLREKCEAIAYFERINDFGGIMKIAFQIGYEHPVDYLTPSEACEKVGIRILDSFDF